MATVEHMESRWSDINAKELADKYGEWDFVALRTYSSRLIGSEPSLVLHGGGNTSVKGFALNVFGDRVPALLVKASGHDLATIEPEGHPPLDLEYLRRLRALPDLSDEAMRNEIRTHLFRYDDPTPSIEALVHAFLPPRFIDHTHADAILGLTNQAGGERVVRDALGESVVVLPYVRPGFRLAKASADAFDASPGCGAMVWMHHGLLTWGDTARESYERTIDCVSRAEDFLRRAATRPVSVSVGRAAGIVSERLPAVAPLVRGVLGRSAATPAGAPSRVIVRPVCDDRILAWLDSPGARDLFVTPPLTSDHLIRTKALPLWVEAPDYEHADRLREQVTSAVARYVEQYEAYLARHRQALPAGVAQFDPLPRTILMPGLGALCAGPDLHAATIAADITAHTLAVKAQIGAAGRYEGLDEGEFVEMEYHVLQHAKLAGEAGVLGAHVALVTGAAGAIGAGICRGLLAQGCQVVATDLPGDPLDSLAAELSGVAGARVVAAPLDVTDAVSVAEGFAVAAREWGGVDLLVVNAGIAHVSSLANLELEAFRKLERVNVEGTLLLLAEAGRRFRHQGTGGDIVLVSTKNVFAPGATFGAYSATKAAAHQLARIASLEFAEIDVRVNMVSPDAVFGDASRKSGLWKAVGPDRMRARGLDEAGLEEYYRSRNLLKARVTAEHVANAVLFFATRQTPTTGATIPVDGGLPDATPR
jgi:rhamnose utilization protein RhaD (predicted bifunctional aldolase and dehydrogenase)/NAD(P)-dependent dehydrogenase (short-subunit alcohol dehydrogenase family)